MQVTKIQKAPIFCNATSQKREFIDIIADNVKNPRDVEDCVAVPRGIFKAYILLMIGSSLMMIANVLPSKWKAVKTCTNIASAIFTGLSAIYFAKPFAIKGLSPTVNKDTKEPVIEK
ncbi:hypothetical protein IJ750_06070 [bacterium]|nr:hypothetical protein [bacterium]